MDTVGWVDPVYKVINTISVVTSLIGKIHNLIENAKNNKELYKDISCRLENLKGLLDSIKEDQSSDEVREALNNLESVLNSAERKIKKFDKAWRVCQVLKSRSYKLKIDRLNQLLSNAYEKLSGALHVQHQQRLHDQEKLQAEQQQRIDDKLQAEQQQRFDDQKKLQAEQQQKFDDQKKLQAEQQQKFDDQKKLQAEQQQRFDDKLQAEQQQRFDDQKKLQAEQQQRFDDQKKLQAEQQQRLDEQEKKMQKMESHSKRKSSCIIL